MRVKAERAQASIAEPGFRLCYLCEEYPPVISPFGGIGVAFQGEAEWLARRGYEVSVVCQTDRRDPGVYACNGVTLYVQRPSRWRKIRALSDRLRTAGLVRRVLGRDPGVVVCADYGGPVLGRPSHQPLVVQLHGCGTLNAWQMGRPIRWQMRYFERRTLCAAEGIRSVSQYTAKHTLDLLRVEGKEVLVLPNPVDTDVFFPKPDGVNPRQVLFVGKLNHLKGVQVLVRAMTGVFERFEDAALTLVGQDMMENGRSVRAQCLEILPERFHSRVTFPGRLPRSEVAERMRRAGVVVLPSFVEAMPMTVLEAMASGRPVVASDRGGIPEVLHQGQTGLLADPGRPSSFTEALLELLNHPQRAHEMGRAGRRIAEEQYTPEAIYGRLLSFYEKMVQSA